ncbi:LytR/AlgR family response regulator transcription factor [Chitinophagaceae bacterium LWZ2-11]
MSKMKCIIVDDEELARQGITNYVEQIEFLELTGCYKNAAAAAKALEEQKADLMFLDINMPKITGLSFLEALAAPPITIITTAYSEYAMEGFRLEVLDYLLKPIAFDRFLKAVNKAKEYWLFQKHTQAGKKENNDYIFLKHNQLYEKVFFSDILYIEAMRNYIVVHTLAKKLMVLLTFKSIEESLPAKDFMRIHKSYIINLNQVEVIESSYVQINKKQLPISRKLKDDVLKQVTARNLLSK